MKINIAIACAALFLIGCSGSNQWIINGKIDGANDKDLILEVSTNGRWYPIDTIRTDKNGSFSASHPASGYPDIYRLTLDGKSLYFPVDSIESVNISGNATDFDSNYTISGSKEAEEMMTANKLINDAVAKVGPAEALTDSVLKRELGQLVVANPSGIVAYYVINKSIGGKPLFNPADRTDVRIIGAVANAYSQLRQRDPRTSYLRNLYLSNRLYAGTDTIAAEVVNLFDINLYDDKGQSHSLVDLSKEGKVILLNFTVYDAEYSPLFNRALNEAYQRYNKQGFEIYQVSVDNDEFTWKQSARNLPWITVYNSPADGSKNLVRYNVQSLPTSYIINRKGELVERIEDADQLSAKIAKHI